MERFLPGRHLIESFGNGGFRLGGVSHQGSIMISPSGIRALPARTIGDLEPPMLQVLVDEKAAIDMLLVGTGPSMAPLPKPVLQWFSANGLPFDLMNTNAAVRTYNVVLEEERRVAAIMLAVDNAHA